jgi:DNA invertase Pin-like site-specific DNA recombinase
MKTNNKKEKSMKGHNVGYIRVSTNGQNTVRQLEGVDLDKIFTDIYTGSVKNRPQLEECLKYLREGDILHVHSIDRLARNLIDLQEIVDTLVGRKVAVKFHAENLEFRNDDNPMAKLTLQIMGSFAEFERKIVKSRQMEGIAIAKKSGKPLGRTPLDMRLSKKAKDLRQKGISVASIGQVLELSRPSVYKLLRHDG